MWSAGNAVREDFISFRSFFLPRPQGTSPGRVSPARTSEDSEREGWLEKAKRAIAKYYRDRERSGDAADEETLPGFSMEHLNTWRWPYFFQADGVRAKVIYARDGGQWYRFVQAAFRKLRYESISGEFDSVTWRLGHPAMLELADDVIFNRLLFLELELDGKEAMLRDVASPAEIDFTDFMKDILGDG